MNMKKSTNRPRLPRKLIVRREIITVLTPHELEKVAGGSALNGCTTGPDEI
jgi:hypothetical protein